MVYPGSSEAQTGTLELRLGQLGFMLGEQVKLLQRSQLLGEPLLVEVKGAQIALSRSEAQIVKIKKL